MFVCKILSNFFYFLLPEFSVLYLPTNLVD